MDKAQIRKIAKGDAEAFRVFYEEYIDKASRIAIAILKDKEFAKEVVQETFIRVYKSFSTFDQSKQFEPWFYRILTNECNRFLKKQKKLVDFKEYTEDMDVQEVEEEDYEELNIAIQNLKDIYRIPLILKYLKGFSEKEIAETLDINQNTIKTRLYKAREILREKLIIRESRREQDV